MDTHTAAGEVRRIESLIHCREVVSLSEPSNSITVIILHVSSSYVPPQTHVPQGCDPGLLLLHPLERCQTHSLFFPCLYRTHTCICIQYNSHVIAVDKKVN